LIIPDVVATYMSNVTSVCKVESTGTGYNAVDLHQTKGIWLW